MKILELKSLDIVDRLLAAFALMFSLLALALTGYLILIEFVWLYLPVVPFAVIYSLLFYFREAIPQSLKVASLIAISLLFGSIGGFIFGSPLYLITMAVLILPVVYTEVSPFQFRSWVGVTLVGVGLLGLLRSTLPSDQVILHTIVAGILITVATLIAQFRLQKLNSALSYLEEERKRNALAGSAAGIGFIRDNIKTGELKLDEAASKIFGLNGSAGKPIAREILRAQFSAQLVCDLDGLLCDVLKGELKDSAVVVGGITNPDGGYKTIKIGITVEYQDGEPAFINSVITDVSDLSRAQSKLRSEIAKQEQLFAIIGHELRTPASALQMLLAEQGVKALEPHGGLIDETITHLLNVLDDMRTVTKPDLVLESPEVRGSVPSVIERSLPLVGRLVVERGLSVTVDASPTAGVNCVIREQLLRQIALNLVKNCALHAKASHLSIYIDAQDQGDEVFFTITFDDNGRGIRQKEQTKIFEAFGRGETESDGSGLGLHIARTYARNILRGDLTYKDSEQGGALFTLTALFPKTSLALENEERKRAEIDSDRVLEGLTILFAEDSPVLRMMTIKQLQMQGATVLAAEDGQEALQRAREETFDLVLTDIFMPNMDGYGLTAALRSEVGFKGPIIGVSAAVVGDESERLLLSGANAIVPKPFNLIELKGKVVENIHLIHTSPKKAAHESRPRVLVVDDDPVTLGRFASFLEDDYEVLTESNALKALATFQAFHPNVVFCDVNMPDMNGLEVLKGIQSFDPSIPIIQMSSTGAAKHYLNIAKTVGATEILNKNDDNEDVLRLLKSVLERDQRAAIRR